MEHRLMIAKESTKPNFIYYVHPGINAKEDDTNIFKIDISNIEYGELDDDESIELDSFYVYGDNHFMYSFSDKFASMIYMFNGFFNKQLIIHEYPDALYLFVKYLDGSKKSKLINDLEKINLEYLFAHNQNESDNELLSRICIRVPCKCYSYKLFNILYSILRSYFPIEYTEREIGYMCRKCFNAIDKKTTVKYPESKIGNTVIYLHGVYEAKCKECNIWDEFIEIDYNILNIVSFMNKSGIKTLYSCEGHYDDDSTYIMFKMSKPDLNKYVIDKDYKGDALNEEIKNKVLDLFIFSYNELNDAYVIGSKPRKKLKDCYKNMDYKDLKSMRLKILNEYVEYIIMSKISENLKKPEEYIGV